MSRTDFMTIKNTLNLMLHAYTAYILMERETFLLQNVPDIDSAAAL